MLLMQGLILALILGVIYKAQAFHSYGGSKHRVSMLVPEDGSSNGPDKSNKFKIITPGDINSLFSSTSSSSNSGKKITPNGSSNGNNGNNRGSRKAAEDDDNDGVKSSRKDEEDDEYADEDEEDDDEDDDEESDDLLSTMGENESKDSFVQEMNDLLQQKKKVYNSLENADSERFIVMQYDEMAKSDEEDTPFIDDEVSDDSEDPGMEYMRLDRVLDKVRFLSLKRRKSLDFIFIFASIDQ